MLIRWMIREGTLDRIVHFYVIILTPVNRTPLMGLVGCVGQGPSTLTAPKLLLDTGGTLSLYTRDETYPLYLSGLCHTATITKHMYEDLIGTLEEYTFELFSREPDLATVGATRQRAY
jgi:hypothetical protein